MFTAGCKKRTVAERVRTEPASNGVKQYHTIHVEERVWYACMVGEMSHGRNYGYRDVYDHLPSQVLEGPGNVSEASKRGFRRVNVSL